MVSVIMDFVELGWQAFDWHMEQHISTHEPARYPGDREICRLLCIICTENNIPVRFYYNKEAIEVQILPDRKEDPDWVLLFDLFTDEYPGILKPEPKVDVKSEFYQTIEDGL